MENNFEKYHCFIDDNDTLFQKLDDDSQYDYKLRDKFGEDFCTRSQMYTWGVKVTKIVEIKDVEDE